MKPTDSIGSPKDGKPKRSRKGQAYRHTPAFILLFLAREDLYGASLLQVMQRELPCYAADTAAVYRALQDLETRGAVRSYWETDISGPARKWYRITDKGFEQLAELKQDIEMRMRNFESFIELYEKITANVSGPDS
ncbi:MAG: PadR family transcriptional regulator [Syntrophobacteraceae bacterium]|nr:PadR family transcriptional regulator [Syntrophobacteraceae bacterium]